MSYSMVKHLHNFSLRLGERIGTRISTITICIQYVQEVLANVIKGKKYGVTIAQEEIKLSLFADGMSIYVENSNEPTIRIKLKKISGLEGQYTKLYFYILETIRK